MKTRLSKEILKTIVSKYLPGNIKDESKCSLLNYLVSVSKGLDDWAAGARTNDERWIKAYEEFQLRNREANREANLAYLLKD
jgi:hypothetical protein